jgi:hypothetical protein
MDGFAAITNKASWATRGLQSGNLQTYVWWYLIGAVLLGGITLVCLI